MSRRTTAHVLMWFSVLVLAACSGTISSRGGRGVPIGTGVTTDSRIVVLNTDGTLPDVGIDESNSVSVSRVSNVGGFAYQMGRVEGQNEFLGVAGVAPNTEVGTAPTAASATYRGDYSLAYADRTEFGAPVSGSITLNADFNNRRLTGQSDGLTIDGRLAGQSISGTATYRGVDADLIGQIGNTRAVGAFAGRTSDAVLTGGFIANRRN